MQLPMFTEVRSKTLKELLRHRAFKDEQIEIITEELCDEINLVYNSTSKNRSSAFGVYIDFEEFVFPSDFLYKLLAGLFKINKKNILPNSTDQFKIILINLKDDDIDNICQRFDNNIGSSTPFPIVLMGKQWKIQVLFGKNREELRYSNHRLHSAYLSNDYFFKKELEQPINLSDETKETLERLIIPYDLMILKNGETLFESFVNHILETPIGSNEIGCKISIPTKIGSKIYVKNYYEADFLFQNNFFADRFAYFIAQNILVKKDTFNNKKIVLVGYNPYSALLVERVKEYLNSCGLEIKKIIIAKEKEKEKGLEFNNILSNSRNNSQSESYGIITIVPIASTLSTNDKIISSFSQQIQKSNIEYIYNYVVILVRDAVTPQPSNKEIFRNWKKNGMIMHTIDTIYQKERTKEGMKVDFLIQKAGEWHDLIDCFTFPEQWWEEGYINHTKNSSLNVKNLLGCPIVAIPGINEIKRELPWTEGMNDDNAKLEYFKVSIRRIWEIRSFIYCGHIEHGDNHYKYFFDIERLFDHKFGSKKTQYLHKNTHEQDHPQQLGYQVKQTNKHRNNNESYPCLYEWLEYVKECLRNDEFLNVIISPDNDFESCFVSTINNRVFDNNAYVIFVNLNDTLQNNRLKLSYLKNTIPQKTHYYFVDQALVTGNTYQKAKSYMVSILEKDSFRFDGIVTVVNRLSQDKYYELLNSLKSHGNKSSHIFSFLHFFVLSSKESGKGCGLCNMFDLYSRLKEYSFNEDCRKEIELNKEKFKLQTYSHYLNWGERKLKHVSENNKDWLRMLRIHQVFFELAKANNNGFINHQLTFQVLSRLYSETVPNQYKELDYKISFLKAISFPPLSQYVIIRKCALKIQLTELHELLKKKNPKLEDLNLLLVILKNLAVLGSNALVREDVILKSWDLYFKVIKKHEKDNLDIRFKRRFVFYLKLATYKDEAKSIWIGELLRTGSEMKVQNYSYSNDFRVSETILFNKIFSHFLESKRGWLPLIFYDNTAITRKTLDSFAYSLEKDPSLKLLFYLNESKKGRTFLKLKAFSEFSKSENIDNIIKDYKNKIDREYYYTWFRHFLNGECKNPDGIPILKKLVYVLYERLLLKDLADSSTQNDKPFDQNAKDLLEIATQIMDADASFISIKAQMDAKMHILAKYNIEKGISDDDNFYCRELLYGKTIEKGRPFIIRKDISDYKEYSLLGSNAYMSATYLMLNGEVNMNPSQESTVGIVTFLYKRKDSYSENVFMINAQESGRLLLLLKPQMDEYVKHVEQEKQFELWKSRQEKIADFIKVNVAENHQLNLKGWSFGDGEENEKDKAIRAKSWFYLSETITKHLFAQLLQFNEIPLFDPNVISHSLNELFDDKFQKLLKLLHEYQWKGSGDWPTSFEINIDERIDNSKEIFGEITVFQSFIIQCMSNSFKHQPKLKNISRNVWINVYLDNNNNGVIEIKNSLNFDESELNDWNNKKKQFINDYSLNHIRNLSYNELRKYRFTLISLLKYLDAINSYYSESHLNYRCEFEYNLEEKPYYFANKILLNSY